MDLRLHPGKRCVEFKIVVHFVFDGGLPDFELFSEGIVIGAANFTHLINTIILVVIIIISSEFDTHNQFLIDDTFFY